MIMSDTALNGYVRSYIQVYTVHFTNEGQIIVCNKTVAKINSEM